MHVREIPPIIFEELVIGEPETHSISEFIEQECPDLSMQIKDRVYNPYEETARTVGETIEGFWLRVEERDAEDQTLLQMFRNRESAVLYTPFARLIAGGHRTGAWKVRDGDEYSEDLALELTGVGVARGAEGLVVFSHQLAFTGIVAAIGGELLGDGRFELSKYYPNRQS